MKFLVPNYSCLQNPGSYRPQILVLSVLCPQLNLLNPSPPNKVPGYATARHIVQLISQIGLVSCLTLLTYVPFSATIQFFRVPQVGNHCYTG